MLENSSRSGSGGRRGCERLTDGWGIGAVLPRLREVRGGGLGYQSRGGRRGERRVNL